MKHIIWKGNTLQNVQLYPKEIKQEIGYELHNVQLGKLPSDWKPMTIIGKGVKEIRVHSEKEYRIIYVACFEEAIYVLHTFVKKTEKTSKKDIGIAKLRYSDVLNRR